MIWHYPNARPSTVILRAKPSEVGQMGHDCACKRLLVTHVMPELEGELHDALALVCRAYQGELIVAEDLM